MTQPLEIAPPRPAVPDGRTLAVLEILAQAAEVPLDPTRAEQALRAAARDIPPTEPRAARQRLTQAAATLGLQVSSRRLSVPEALTFVAHETPLAIFSLTPASVARWFVLLESDGSQGRLVDPEEAAAGNGTANGWMSADEIALTLGAVNKDAVLEWLVGLPATPVPEATRETPVRIADHGGRLTGHLAPHGGPHAHGHHHSRMPPFRRLLGLLRPDLRELLVVVLFAIGVGIFTLATPVVTMAVVNTVAFGTLIQQLLVLCVGLLIALGLASGLSLLQNVIVEFIQRRVFVRVANDLAFRLPRVDLQAFDRQHGPELVNRFFDVLTVQKAAATLLLDGVMLGLQILIGLILLGYYHVYLLGFDLILLLCLGFLFAVLGRGAVRTAIQESIAKYAVAGWMEEVARHPIAFKSAGGTQLALEQTDMLTRVYLLNRAAHFRILIRQIGFALFLQVVANVALLGLGGWLVIQGQLTLGELVAAEIVVTLVVATFAKLGKQFEAFYDLLAAVDKLGHLLDLPLERLGGERHQSHTGGATVVVHDVAFTYEGQRNPALSGLSLRVEAGERVAIVGPNGAGKSTLLDILYGLRNPEHGWVQIDGADLRSIRLETLREHVSMAKGIQVIEATILENVRMGRDEITQADVREALERVGLLETVLALPDGLETRLWTGGSPLSLGQANRLMIARAIVGQPRLVLLDEALDHMDSELRRKVIPALFGPDTRWTLIVVTHSDEVARLCDRVIRLTPPYPVNP